MIGKGTNVLFAERFRRTWNRMGGLGRAEAMRRAADYIRRIFFSLQIIIDMDKRFVTFLVIFAIATAQCPASFNINNLLAESVTFSSNQNPRQTFTAIFPRRFDITPLIALGLQDFSTEHIGQGGFAVYPQSIDPSKVVFNFDSSPLFWRKIRINFWASANSQIQLGYWRTDSIEVQSKCHCAESTTQIAQAFPAHSNPVIRVFLNGYDVSLNTIVQISVSPTNLQGTTLTVKITVGPKTTLRRAWLSWLAFVPREASFGSYGGQVAESNFKGTNSKDVSNSLYFSPYKLYGVNLLSLTNSGALQFACSIDDDFVMTISSSDVINHFSIVYISVGVPTSEVCSNCGSNLVVSGTQCAAACPAGTLPFSYKDGGVGCRKCSSKLGLILSAGKCVTGKTTVTTTTTTTTINTSGKGTTSTAGTGMGTGIGSNSTTKVTKPPVTTPTQPITTPTPQPPVTTPPQPVTAPPQPPVTTSPQPPNTTPVRISCVEHAFWNGHECVCEVGYTLVDSTCVVPTIPVAVPILISYPGKTCGNENQGSHDQGNTGSSGSGSTNSGNTDNSGSGSGSGSTSTSGSSSSSSGSGSTSTPGHTSPVNCGPNAFDNGLGICVCAQGYHFQNGICTSGEPCQANAARDGTGKCVCNQGYNLYERVCSRCPAGALWSSSANRCIYVCGQNSAYSAQAGKCVCNPGFGILNKVCEKCPSNYFIREGFCVTCPIHSKYNADAKRCECVDGFYTDHYGICVQKCGTNQVYNKENQQCQCISGLGRVNGACQVCPAGSRPTANGDGCNSCRVNEELVAGRCTCMEGYAYNKAGVCTVCSELNNGFLINGVCAVCPGSLIYNGRECSCPTGKINENNRCISQCKNDELLDKNGNCYTCSSNQIISNGQCVCAPGYKLSSCGVCQLGCAQGEFAFQGACATCPLNTVYIQSINGCNCPNGFYKDSFGTCQKLELPQVQCNEGLYFDKEKGCIPCTAPCKSCKSATQCTTCASSGFVANSAGVCGPKCGDGLIVGTEQCDPGTAGSAGCLSCRITAGWTCTGQPSICRQNVTPTPTPQPPVTTPPTNSPSLTLQGAPNINSNNVFVSLQTNPTFTFANPTQMQSFIKAEFSNGPKPTVYCSQRNSPQLDMFDCLLIYPSGVPNSIFEVDFSYNKDNKRASARVEVNPLAITNSRRARQ